MDSQPPTAERRPGLLARLLAELKRLAVLTVLGGLLVIAGKYYCFDRLDEEIRARVENQLRSHYQGLAVTVRAARRVAGRGVEIRGIRIAEAGGAEAPILAEIDEIFAECDTRLPDFLTKPPQINILHVHRLKLRAQRKPTGFWNLSHLLPLPPCQSTTPPRATITDAALEIVDPTQDPACAWTLRNIELTVQPQEASGMREYPGVDDRQSAGPPNREATTALQWCPASRSPSTILHLHGTLVGDHVERVEIDGLLDPETGCWDMRGAVEGLEFNPRLRAALPRELSAAVAPLSSVRGRTYFGFHAQRPPREGRLPHAPPLEFVIHGNISEGRIDDARLPEPLTDVEATIRCDNHGILIEDMSARCGETQLELNASLAGFGGAGPIDVELTARQLQLQRLPTAALPPQVAETWARFSPRGLADVSGRLKFDGQQWQPDLTIECHDLSLTYDRFPYRLTDGSGTIAVQPDCVSVRLRTIGGGQTVRCRAEVRRPGRDFTGWIEIQAEGPVPIDDKLMAAMDLPTQRLVRSFRPRGGASFQARFHRATGESLLHKNLSIQLQDCSIQHERFPYPIDKVSGLLELTDDTWLFRNLTGRNDSASLAGEGSWQDAGEGGRQLTLQFSATDVPLADELRQALPVGPQRLWTNLRPRGNIDHLVVGLRYGAGSRQWSIDVRAEKWQPRQAMEGRTISLEPLWFPYRLDNLTGGFHYRDGQMELTNLHAVHGRAAITAEGGCRVLADGGSRLELTRLAADRVEVDQELLSSLPAGLAQSLGRYPLDGPLNLQGALSITVPLAVDAPPELDWDLSLDLENARVLTSTPVEHVHGGVGLVGRQRAEGMLCRGELKIDSAMIRGVQLTSVAGPLWFDGRRLVFGSLADQGAPGHLPRQVTAHVLGGLLSLDGEVSLAQDGTFQVQPTLENADLHQIAQQLAPHHRGLVGKVFGLAKIGGNSQGMHTWHGDGQIRLRDADIYSLPVMIALLKLLSIQRPDRTAFTTSDIDFRIEGDDLALDRIDFSGDAISLKGKGRMNGQRQIDLKFYPVFGREERHLPILRPLLGETGREFMLIEVKGTLDQPRVDRRVFPRIDAQLQQLFPELARDERVEPTLPAFSPPREANGRLRLLPWR